MAKNSFVSSMPDFDVQRERGYAERTFEMVHDASTDMLVQRIDNLARALIRACDEIERLSKP